MADIPDIRPVTRLRSIVIAKDSTDALKFNCGRSSLQLSCTLTSARSAYVRKGRLTSAYQPARVPSPRKCRTSALSPLRLPNDAVAAHRSELSRRGPQKHVTRRLTREPTVPARRRFLLSPRRLASGRQNRRSRHRRSGLPRTARVGQAPSHRRTPPVRCCAPG
jgi:hypothetical protein